MSFRRILLSVYLGTFVLGGFWTPQAHGAAGEILWSPDHSLAGKQEAVAAAVDDAGGVVVTGYSENTSTDIFTVKFRADGAGSLWNVTKDHSGGIDKATDVVVDGNGDVIVVGYVRNGTHDDFYTVKYAGATGAVVWQHPLTVSATGDDRATAVAVDNLNNIYVGGLAPSLGGTPRDDYYIVKYSPTGPVGDNPMWQVRTDGGFDGHDRITDIWVDGTDLVVTGTSQNATDFDCLTVKFTTDGDLVWPRRYGLSGADSGQAVRLDAGGNVIMAGYANNGNNNDLYVVKYLAATGAVDWEKPYDSGRDEALTELWVDVAGDAYVAGYVDTLTGARDFYIARHAAADGTVVWDDIRNTTNGDQDVCTGIVVDELGDVFITGSSFAQATTQYNFVTMKYKRDTGARLWLGPYSHASGKDDRPIWVGQSPSGDLFVAGWTDVWTAGASDYNFVAVKHDPGLLNAPTDLQATTVSESQIGLVWTDNSSDPNEEHFSIERRDGVSPWAEIDTVVAGTTTYNDTGLTANIRYTYRVLAYTAADGYSHPSNEADAKTIVITYGTPAWTVTYDNGSQDEAMGIAAGPDGHPVVTGFSLDSVGSFDYYTLKLDRGANGAELWHARYNDGDDEVDIAEAVVVDRSNRVVVTGYSSLYGGGSGNTNDVWTVGYASTGPTGPIQPNWSWGNQYNGPAGNDDRSEAIDAATDGSDNVAVVGYGKNASANDDIYVLKFSPNGTREWAALPYDGGGIAHPTAVTFDPSGNVIVVGYSHDGTGYDAFVAKYLAGTGVADWQKTFGGPGDGGDYGNDYAQAVAVDASGDVYVTGSAVTADGDVDFYTFKVFGADGTMDWDTLHNGPANGDDTAAGIAVDPLDGRVAVAGTQLTAAGNQDFFVIRYEAADGTEVWQETLERPQDDVLWAMSMDNSGNVCLAGQTSSGSDLDMLSTKFDHQGVIIGAAVYAGVAGQDDVATAVTTNRHGETFVAGFTTNASGNSDYAVYTCSDDALPVPGPVTATPAFTEVQLTWNNNPLDEDGFTVERKVGTCASAATWNPLTSTAADVTSHTDTGISVGTAYCYRVQAFRNNGDRSRWSEAGATTRTPVEVTDLTATTASTTDIDLAWTDTTTGVASWQILRCQGAGCTPTAEVTVLPPGSATYRDQTLAEGQPYHYKVIGQGTGWSTGNCNIAGDTTDSPVAPTGLTVSWIAENRLNLGWTDGVPDETAFVVERCLNSGCSNFSELQTLGAGSQSYSDLSVQPTTTYRYRVRSRKVTAWNTWDSPGTTNEIEIEAAAPAPILTASPANTTQVSLSWTNTTASESGFQAERCTGTTAACTTTPVFSPVGGTPTTIANVLTFADTSVVEGQTYTYRVRAVGNTPAPWTTPDSVWRQAVTPAAAIPTGLAVNAITESEVQVDWNDANADEIGFRVWRCQNAGCTSGFSQVGPVQPNATGGSYIDNSVAIGVTYGYYVEVYKDGVTNPWSKSTGILYATPTLDPPALTGATASVGADCADLRFSTLSDGSSLLPYWVESGCGTANTRAHVKLPTLASGASSLYLFTGNPTALPMSDPNTVFEFFDDFRGTTVDASKWIKTGDSSISQNDGLQLRYISRSYRSLVSQQTFTRSPTREVYMKVHVPDLLQSTYQQARIGWYRNYTGASTSYISHAMYWAAPNVNGMEYTTNEGNFGTYAVNTDYETRVALEPTGAGYWIKGGQWSDWTTITDVPTYNFTPVRVAILQYGANLDINLVAVRPFAALVPTVTDAADQVGSYSLAAGTWGARRTLSVENGGGALTNYQLPADISTSTLAIDRVILTWTDTTEGETGFVIERCLDTGASCNSTLDIGFDTSFTVSGTTTFTDKTVAESSTYQYRVKAITTLPWTETGWSNVMSATTVTPADPTNLTLVSVGESAVGLSWDDNTGNETLFEIERCEGAGCSSFGPLPSTAPAATTVAADTTTFLDDSVCPATPYRYRVRAVREGAWFTGYSNILPTTTLTVLTDAPTGVTATALSESEIQVSWTPQTVDETSFKVERCDGVCIELDAIGNGVTSFIDDGLSPSTSFTYRVKALGGAACVWETPYSTPPAAEPTLTPPAPSGLTATRPNTTQVDLNWNDETGSETLYHVYRCEGVGCTPTVPITGAGLSQDTEFYPDTEVKAGTGYVYKVEAYNAAWQTSANVAVTTLSPSEPTSLVATKASEVAVSLDWNYTPADETGFSVARCEGSACTGFSQIALIAPGTNTYSDTTATGLSANKFWRYQVSPVKTGVTYPWNPLPYSAPANADTLPIPPSGVTALAANTTVVTLNWTSHTPTATGFEVWRCAGTGCSSGFTQVGTPTSAPFTDNTAAHSTPYGYQIRALNPAWIAANCASTTAYGSTPTPLPPILQPATVFSDTSVLLDWTIRTTDETGFVVERCETNVGQTCSNFSTYETALPATVGTYADLGAQASRAHCYRVSAYKTAVQSWGPLVSSPVCASMPPAQADTPMLTALNARMIQVDWSAPSVDEDGFDVEVKAENGRFVVAGTVGPDIHTYVDSMALEPETAYTYRVTAFRGSDRAPPSGEETTSTLDLNSGSETCPP